MYSYEEPKRPEDIIVAILGALIVIVLGVTIINYFKEANDGQNEYVSVEEPCEEYQNWQIRNVPAHCAKYFLGGEGE